MIPVFFEGVLAFTFCNGEERIYTVEMGVVPADEKLARVASLTIVKRNAFNILGDIAEIKTPRSFESFFDENDKGALVVPAPGTAFLAPKNLVKLKRF